jgi:hypothetical protein
MRVSEELNQITQNMTLYKIRSHHETKISQKIILIIGVDRFLGSRM